MSKHHIRILTVISCLAMAASGATAADPTLTDQLKAASEGGKKQMPVEVQATMAKALQSLRESGIEGKALHRGETMPDFELPGVDGKPVSSKALRKKGPLVITFYRGAWCPFCNMQLHDLQKHMGEFKAAGATLIAISPQLPDGSLSMTQKQSLQFHVLSDAGNKTAKAFGVSYTMTPELVQVYKGFGLDLSKINGSPDWELPLAASYVVDKAGKVAYAYVDVDYTKRAETLDLIDEVKALKKGLIDPNGGGGY